MYEVVHRPDETDEYYFQEGCHVLELCNSAGDPAVSIARVRVAPGVTTRWHSLRGVTERYVILAGRGRVEIGDAPPQIVAPDAVVTMAPGGRQCITNTGGNDLVFLVLCSPRFTLDVYQALGDETDGR